MEKTFVKAGELKTTIREYLQVRMDLAKVEVIDTGSSILSQLAALLISGILLLCCTVFGGIALSIFINNWMNTSWAGFLIVAFVYLFLAGIAWIKRERIIRLPLVNMMIRELFGYDKKN